MIKRPVLFALVVLLGALISSPHAQMAYHAVQGGGSVSNYYTDGAFSGIGGTAFTPTRTLHVNGTTSTNFFVARGSAQSGNVVDVQFGTSVNDLISISAGGTLSAATNGVGTKYQLVGADGAESIRMASGLVLQFNSTANLAGGAIDTGLARTSAGVVEVNNGTIGTVRDLRVRGVQLVTGTEPTCNEAARGTTWYVAGGAGVADTYRLCRKDAADVYAWVSLF